VAQRSPLIDRAVTEEAPPDSHSERGVDPETLRRIFDENVAFVWRSLRHLGIGESDIEDVCQEVFIVVHRKFAEFEGRSALRTWLYGICLRVAKDHRRRAYVRREVAVSEPPRSAQSATQEEDYRRVEARRTLGTILDRLDEDKRAVFVLYEIEGLSMKEVAETMDCPLQTAYSRLHAARRVVVEELKRLEIERQR
jgi:RNA polymerase sigma-70 factor (ECF subfamily)